MVNYPPPHYREKVLNGTSFERSWYRWFTDLKSNLDNSNFIALTDTPDAYTGAAGYKVVVDGTGTGLTFVDDTNTFDNLTDTPSNKIGSGGFVLMVNGAETDLEYIDWIDQSVKEDASPTFAGLTIDNLTGVLRADSGVVSVAGDQENSLIKVNYDERVITMTGLVPTTVVYKLASSIVETLTLAYDANNRISTKSTAVGGETLTFTYDVNGNILTVIKT